MSRNQSARISNQTSCCGVHYAHFKSQAAEDIGCRHKLGVHLPLACKQMSRFIAVSLLENRTLLHYSKKIWEVLVWYLSGHYTQHTVLMLDLFTSVHSNLRQAEKSFNIRHPRWYADTNVYLHL
jgi:hypothetical protein